MSGEVRLDEFDADEWFEVTRLFRPDITREQFDEQWAEFLAKKQAKALQ